MSSSGSRERLRRPPLLGPRFAADMLGRRGELVSVRSAVTHSFVGTRVNCASVRASYAAGHTLGESTSFVYAESLQSIVEMTEIEVKSDVVTERNASSFGKRVER